MKINMFKYICKDCLRTFKSNEERPGWFCWDCGKDLVCIQSPVEIVN